MADEMGLGKTVQAILACDEMMARTVRVLCPASVVENWKREFDRWATCGRLLTVQSYDKALRAWGKEEFGPTEVLICDEAHYLKNPKAKRTKMVFGPKCTGKDGLVELADRSMMLSGTPMPNNPAELWPMLRALAPETILHPKKGTPLSYGGFIGKYCHTVTTPFGMQIKGGKNHAKLAAALDGFMLRRTKADVLPDMPPIVCSELYLDAHIPEATGEAALVRAVLEKKGVDGLAEIAPQVSTLRRYTGMAKVAPVGSWIDTWFECGGGKLVVFAHHREVMDALQERLTTTALVRVDGSATQTARQDAVDKFQNDSDVRVFLGQVQAAGEGITLTAASDVLFVEPSWVPKDNQQAMMRVHRIGQTRACSVRFATVAGSIDEAIQRAVVRKTTDITKILEAV